MWIHKLGSPWRQAQARAALGTETGRVERRGGHPPAALMWGNGTVAWTGVEGDRRAVGTAGLSMRGHMVTWGSGDSSGASGKGEGVTLTRGPSRGPEHVDCGVHPRRPRLGAVGGYGVPSGQSVPSVGLGPSLALTPYHSGDPHSPTAPTTQAAETLPSLRSVLWAVPSGLGLAAQSLLARGPRCLVSTGEACGPGAESARAA